MHNKANLPTIRRSMCSIILVLSLIYLPLLSNGWGCFGRAHSGVYTGMPHFGALCSSRGPLPKQNFSLNVCLEHLPFSGYPFSATGLMGKADLLMLEVCE